MIGYFTSSDGLRLAYRDEGSGPVVLCLAGLTRNSTDFDYMLPHFDGYRFIRPDYRGRGASDHAADPADYAVPVEMRDVLELLDHLGIDRMAVIGTSRGGLIAMGLASAARSRVTGICLNDIGPEIARAGLERIADYVGRRPGAHDLDALAGSLARFHAEFGPVPEGRWQQEAARRAVETENGLMLNYDPKLRDAFLRDMAAPPVDLWPFFDGLAGLPLALIRGARSDLLSMETSTEMRRRRPDMIFANVSERGHVPFLDEPESITALKQFLGSLN